MKRAFEQILKILDNGFIHARAVWIVQVLLAFALLSAAGLNSPMEPGVGIDLRAVSTAPWSGLLTAGIAILFIVYILATYRRHYPFSREGDGDASAGTRPENALLRMLAHLCDYTTILLNLLALSIAFFPFLLAVHWFWVLLIAQLPMIISVQLRRDAVGD